MHRKGSPSLRLYEIQAPASPIAVSILSWTFLGYPTRPRLTTICQLQGVGYPRGHLKIAIPQTKLELESGEEAILPSIPGNHHLYTGNFVVVSVEDVNLDQWNLDVGVAYAFEIREFEGCPLSGCRGICPLGCVG